MANSKLTGLSATTTPTTTDIFYIVTDPGGTPTSQKVTGANMRKALALDTTDTPQFARLGVGGAADATHLTKIALGTVTADTHAIDITGTWNNSGVTFIGIKANITNTASASASKVLDMQIGGTSKMVLDSTGALLVGASTNVAFFTSNPGFLVAGTSGDSFTAYARYANSANGPTHAMIKSRGTTVGTHAVLQAHDQTGQIAFLGSDGSAYRDAARVIGFMDNGTINSSSYPGRLSLYTTPNGTTVTVERLRIDQAGNIIAAAAAPIAWANSTFSDTTFPTIDLFLFRDAAGTLAQRNSTNAQTFRVYNTYTDSSNYERGVIDWGTTSNTLTIGAQAAGTGTLRQVQLVGASVKISDIDVVLGTTTGTKIGTATTQKLAFYNSTPVVQQTDGAALTNNVTSGGTDNTIANFTDLTIYANDAATIRNDIYQLARKVKIIGDALRTYGLLS